MTTAYGEHINIQKKHDVTSSVGGL